MPVVQAFGREQFNEQRFAQTTRDALAATLANTKLQVQFTILVGLATAAGTVGVLWLGGPHALAAPFGPRRIFLFLSFLGSFFPAPAHFMYFFFPISETAGPA